jgi:ATP-dependent helicase Lhr and Lhr-like helicase
VTPLRALAADTAQALEQAVGGLGLPWSVEIRTADTAAALRNRQQRRLPSILVTTPESLTLQLARDDVGDRFRGLRATVVDEWHELLGSKRGVQTELALARLRKLRRRLRIWGLSATLGDLKAARDALLGSGARRGLLIEGGAQKRYVIDSLRPARIERFPWAGHLGLKLLPGVLEGLDGCRSALIFTNTRSQAETWYQAILESRPEWAGEIALHHGSLDREARCWVEQGLRDGRLRAVVCTSSLDLGVDFSPVDRVFQIGSPKGVARLLQRAGRSGHQPGAVSRVTCVPAHAFELVEIAAARAALEAGRIEPRETLRAPLDVLAQHVATVGLGGGFKADELLREVRATRAFGELEEADWRWTLDFVAHGGRALYAYPEHRRLTQEGGLWRMTDAKVARRHRMSIGTIVGDAAMRVQFLNGGLVGSVEESFISRLKPGDCFIFGGRALELVRVRDMTAWVRKSPVRKGVTPRWMGGQAPLSSELAAAVREKLDEARRGIFDSCEMRAVRPVLELQQAWSALPRPDELLIERIRTREGWRLFFYPFDGRSAHQGLAALTAFRLAEIRSITFSISVNDYGFELLSAAEPPLEEGLEAGLFDPRGLEADILSSLNAAEMARRQFREIARIAGLVFQGYPGRGKPARHLQASSSLIFDVFERHDPGNLLLRQARDELLSRQLDQARMLETLRRIGRGGSCCDRRRGRRRCVFR